MWWRRKKQDPKQDPKVVQTIRNLCQKTPDMEELLFGRRVFRKWRTREGHVALFVGPSVVSLRVARHGLEHNWNVPLASVPEAKRLWDDYFTTKGRVAQEALDSVKYL